MSEKSPPLRNLGLDLVRATEAAAVSAGRWMGLGHVDGVDDQAALAMREILDTLDMAGTIVVGEEGKVGHHSPLDTAMPVGTGEGPELDVVVDPIDGRTLLAQGRSGAVAVVAVAPRDSMWAPHPAIYMDKIVVDREVAHALVPECLDAPAGWTLALLARAKHKEIRDLVVFVLERPRHVELIEEIRAAGARVMLRADGDVAGALLAAQPRSSVDVLMGVGGVPEGVIAACAIRALGGAMLGRLSPQSAAERESIEMAGLDTERILRCEELVMSNEIFFAVTGITDGPLLKGVQYEGRFANTHSLILRGVTGTRRTLRAEHLVDAPL